MAKKNKARASVGVHVAPAAAAVAARAPSPWIINPFWDSVLFIGAPLAVIAAFLPLRGVFTSQQIAVFLLAFFTFGHHFPTFLRAYGDRELFERFRWRFLLAPPLLFGAALWFNSRDLHGLLIFVALWDIWHVLMQHYGFMRIYDSKAGAISPVTSWLDWGLSISWYLTLIAVSPHYSLNLLTRAYQTGLPLVSPETLEGARTGMLAVSSLLTLAYVGYHLDLWRRGKPVSLRKLTLLGIFLGATFYLYVYLEDFLVGFTVWSAFHCIQYYGIVWVYNRNRVDKNGAMTRLARFLFRPKVGMAVLYMALIFAYGSINYWTGAISGRMLQEILIALIVTSNGLHYYYDGFIWKVRDRKTREDLNIASLEESPSQPLRTFSQYLRRLRAADRGWLEGAALAAVLIGLAALEMKRPNDELAVSASLAAVAPTVGEAQYNYASVLWRQGRLEEAVEVFETAEPLMEDSSKFYNNLGGALYDAGRIEEAIGNYRKALALYQPGEEDAWTRSTSPLMPGTAASPHANPDLVHTNLADALARAGKPEEAVEHYRRALELNPAAVKARAGLGATLGDLGRYEEAVSELEIAVQQDPSYAAAHINLASLLAYLGEDQRALIHFRAAMNNGDDRARRVAAAGIARLQGERAMP